MAEHGLDAVNVTDITEAADVGVGSFYNHFASKDALYEAVLADAFEAFGTELDRLVEQEADPAVRISACIRRTVARASADALWGRMLIRESFSPTATRTGLAPRLKRDIDDGVTTGRLHLHDPTLSFVMVGTGVIGSISACLSAQQRATRDTADWPERTATLVLESLGVSNNDAHDIARRPLPRVQAAPRKR